MMGNPQLITVCKFAEQDYLIKLFTRENKYLELSVMNKFTRDEWQCCYEPSYVEAMTQKTGNFKQFEIFTAMLRAGLLKTSDCISLDLLTFDDLKKLRNHRKYNHASNERNYESEKRYLILTYTVEFDKIHYPLPLEYNGPPDPKLQQKIIHKLQSDLFHMKKLLQNNHCEPSVNERVKLRNKILESENFSLKQKIKNIQAASNRKETAVLQRALKELEKGVLTERESHHRLVQRLRADNTRLTNELHRLRKNERALLSRLQNNNMRGKQLSPINPENKRFRPTTTTGENSKNDFIRNRTHSLSPNPTTRFMHKPRSAKRIFNGSNKSNSCNNSTLTRRSSTESKNLSFSPDTDCNFLTNRSHSNKSSHSQSSSKFSFRDVPHNINEKKILKNMKKKKSCGIEERIKNLQMLIS